MKVVLIYPRLNKEDFGSGSIDYPLGILYLASYLKQQKVNIEVIDATFMSGWQEFRKSLKATDGNILGFSFSSPMADLAFRAITIAKKVFPQAIVVAGGPHPTVDPAGTISRGADVVVVGEGENILLQIIKAVKNNKEFSKIEGICYRKKGKLICQPRKGFIENLDHLPFPDRSLLEIKKYLQNTGSLHLITTRGCPFNCFFCQPTQRKLFGAKVRAESPRRVIEEVKSLKEKYGGYNFALFFADDTFTYNKERTLEICQLLRRHKLNKIPWWCHSRANTFDEEIAFEIKRSGCLGVSFGVESGSPRILTEAMKKGITVEQIRNVFSLCHKHSLLSLAYLMIGTPTETIEDLKMTQRLIAEIHPDLISISRTTPTPGSELYEYARRHSLLKIKKAKDYGYYGETHPLKLVNLTEEEIRAYKKKWAYTYFLGLYKNFPKYFKILFLSSNRLLLLKYGLAKIRRRLRWFR